MKDEHKLLLTVFSAVVREGDWFLILDDERGPRFAWSPEPFPVAFHAQPAHPGQAPYGIYVRTDARVNGNVPNNFQATAANRPPFPGEWGVLSWAPEGAWEPKATIWSGANLLNFAIGFEERFKQGV